MDFAWDPSGSIDVVAHFQAVPDVTLSFSGGSMNQTVMAAFVLLLVLIAAQAGGLAFTIWGRLQKATSLWKIILVGNPTMQHSALLRRECCLVRESCQKLHSLLL